MEFNYLVEKKRMIESLGNINKKYCDGKACNKCPLSSNKNGCYVTCSNFEIEHPLEATEIVRKWVEEHPQKTRKDILHEAFPKATIDKNCVRKLGLCSEIELPCCVGDTVYTNHSMQGWYMQKKNRPYEAKVVFIGINGVDNFINVELGEGKMLQFNFSDIGERVFLTKEAAEAALKESEQE